MSAVKNESGLYEVQIGEEMYEFEKWGAEESLTTLLKIAKIVGKPLGVVIAGIMGDEAPKEETLFEKKGLIDKNLKPEVIAMILEAITGNIDEAVCVSLIKKFSSEKVLCNGAKIVFSKHYEDRLEVAFQVVNAGLGVQYGNFLNALLAVLPVKGVVKSKVQGIINRTAQM